MLKTGKDRMCTTGWVRITDLGPVKTDRFAAVRERCRDNHPLRRVSVFKVCICSTARELVEPPCGIRTVVASVAAVSVNHLRPRVPVARRVVVRPRTVVLRPAYDLGRI